MTKVSDRANSLVDIYISRAFLFAVMDLKKKRTNDDCSIVKILMESRVNAWWNTAATW